MLHGLVTGLCAVKHRMGSVDSPERQGIKSDRNGSSGSASGSFLLGQRAALAKPAQECRRVLPYHPDAFCKLACEPDPKGRHGVGLQERKINVYPPFGAGLCFV